jgi:hypothetical protein
MRGYRRFGFAATIVAVVSLMVAQYAPPLTAPFPAAAVGEASPTSGAAKRQQVQERVDQRDAIIRHLLQRVESLEREQLAFASVRPGPTNVAASEAQEATPLRQPTVQAPTTVAPDVSRASSEPTRSGLGEFVVSDEAIEHVPERALAQTGAAKVGAARKFLNDNQLDSVTAGGTSIDIELSAAAEGPTAVASTQGSITTALTSVLRIAMDLSAPEPARARLQGVSTAEVVFANGKAGAVGTSNVQCSAIPTAVGDAAYVAQARTATAISATCSCSGFAIGIVTQ